MEPVLSQMKFLFIIPATIGFCLLMYVFLAYLPNQVQATEIGRRIWPFIERVWTFFFTIIGWMVIVGPITILLGHRLEYFENVNLAVIMLWVPTLYVALSYVLLIGLVIILKAMQFLRNTR